MTDYHGRIMNLPHVKPYAADLYKYGHRDARHAAAEIALEAQTERDALAAKLAQAEASDAESMAMFRRVRDERDVLVAEVERLRALVELAYREGVADGPWWGAAWATSKARAALARPAKGAGE